MSASADEASAAVRWGTELGAWALPEDLLAAAPESPYGWPASLFRRWNDVAETVAEPTPTAAAIAELLPDRGTLLDVGAGTGRVCLPFARAGCRVIAVEPNPGMSDALETEVGLAAGPGAGSVEVIRTKWPISDPLPWSGSVDVAVSANVVYDVADIAPFIKRLTEVSPAVVVELTTTHPWSALSPYYKALHDLDRPDGPTLALFVQVVREEVGARPQVREWSRSAGMYFESWDEILTLYSKRLLVGPDRRDELRAVLEPDIRWDAGRAYLGDDRRMATVVWHRPE